MMTIAQFETVTAIAAGLRPVKIVQTKGTSSTAEVAFFPSGSEAPKYIPYTLTMSGVSYLIGDKETALLREDLKAIPPTSVEAERAISASDCSSQSLELG
ncbi:hypothetical protein TNCV_1753641 [Trichonephila clavipes]|nr:hypothetical protein TNCV_1753641 [Trichonephila clavipes]